MPIELTTESKIYRLKQPFQITNYCFETAEIIMVTLNNTEHYGRGEAVGVYYLADDVENIRDTIKRFDPELKAGLTREELRYLLPSGGARNAVDCALWELESRQSGRSVWELAAVPRPRKLVTTFTIPVIDPADIVDRITPLQAARAIKLKLDGDLATDIERIRCLRQLRPDVWIGVDANQGYDLNKLDLLLEHLISAEVALIEQPLPRGSEQDLAGMKCPIPIGADESIQDLQEFYELQGYFDVINIKLDKCGGLTEGLAIARAAIRLGKQVMVGCMSSTALSTAPQFVLGQLCSIVDLDGPYFLAEDPWNIPLYHDGYISLPAGFWGAAGDDYAS